MPVPGSASRERGRGCVSSPADLDHPDPADGAATERQGTPRTLCYTGRSRACAMFLDELVLRRQGAPAHRRRARSCPPRRRCGRRRPIIAKDGVTSGIAAVCSHSVDWRKGCERHVAPWSHRLSNDARASCRREQSTGEPQCRSERGLFVPAGYYLCNAWFPERWTIVHSVAHRRAAEQPDVVCVSRPSKPAIGWC